MRNRIIAIAALVVLVILVVNLVSCVARAISGSGEQQSQDSAAAENQAQAGTESQGSAEGQASASAQAAAVPAGEGVDDPWVEGGKFTTGDAELDKLVKDFCDQNSNSSASAAENAENVYHQAVWRDYVEDDTNQEPVGPNWDIEYAKQSLKKGSGNCYEFAAVDEYILKYFGYSDAQAEPCLVKLQSGAYGDHGLTFVTDFDGRKCLCDSSFGANGWLLDADSYTVQLVDIGQDESEHSLADFEEIVTAKWLNGSSTQESSQQDGATQEEDATQGDPQQEDATQEEDATQDDPQQEDATQEA